MENKTYMAPSVEIIFMKVEDGYRGSGDDNGGISAPGWGII